MLLPCRAAATSYDTDSMGIGLGFHVQGGTIIGNQLVGGRGTFGPVYAGTVARLPVTRQQAEDVVRPETVEKLVLVAAPFKRDLFRMLGVRPDHCFQLKAVGN